MEPRIKRDPVDDKPAMSKLAESIIEVTKAAFDPSLDISVHERRERQVAFHNLLEK